MTMRLRKGSTKLALVFAALLCVASQGSAQTKTAAKPKATRKAKAGLAPAHASASKPAEDPVVGASEATTKRDPFSPLISEKKDTAGGMHLPPGKAGLVIATVRVDGAVHSPSGMIAVVSNPGDSVYFIREGDQLYDGDVEKIGLDGVTFRENSKDAFGKPVERMVTKRIYASAGAQQ
jgi:Tfp pilus assembly protein PilP